MIPGEVNMDPYNSRSMANADLQLYRALCVGDLPAARILCGFTGKETGSDNPASAFNRGLCLFLLEEYESALSELNHAERQLGNPPELDISDKKLFTKAFELANREKKLCLLPLDPDSVNVCARYMLIRVKWLTALCLKALGREGEAAMIKRFLARYDIDN